MALNAPAEECKLDSVATKLLSGLFSQRRTGKFCDIKIHVGSTCLWAHSCVLSTFSSKLHNSFVNLEISNKRLNKKKLDIYKNWSLNKPLEIFLSDLADSDELLNYECLECADKVIDFIYNGRIGINLEHIQHIEAFGKLFCINELDELCQEARIKLIPVQEEMLENADLPDPELKEKSDGKILAVKGHPYSCLGCGSKQRTVTALLDHLKDPAHDNTNLNCSLCLRYTAKNSSDLLSHLNLHEHNLPFFCLNCDARFRTRTALSSHEPRHSTETPFLCGKCGKGFKWKHALINHELVHSDEKRHLCDTCGYTTAHISTFKAHKMVHAGVCFKCPVPNCQFVATRKQSLMQHISTHSNQRQYQCEVCGQSFSMHKNLRRHAAKHEPSPAGLMCCPVPGCLYSNTRLDKVKAHAERHKSGKPVRTSLIPRVRQTTTKKQNNSNLTDGEMLIFPTVNADVEMNDQNLVFVIPMEVAPIVDNIRNTESELKPELL